MIKKTCKECGEEFSAQRSDKKFCTDECRYSNWQHNKFNSNKQQNSNTTPQLRGVITDITIEDENETPILSNPITAEIEFQTNEKYNNLWYRIKAKESEFKNLESQKDLLQQRQIGIKYQKSGINGASAIFGASIAGSLKNNNDVVESAILGGIGGLIAGEVIQSIFKKPLENQKEKESTEILAEMEGINVKQTLLNEEIARLKSELDAMEPFTLLPLKTPEGILGNKNITQKITEQEVAPVTEENNNKRLAVTEEKDINVNTSEKIISVAQLKKLNYRALRFQDDWLNLFGLPSVNFQCAISGMAGQGKSTFAIQFANYLAENFGKVIYVSGEEGFSKTMKDKFVNNKINSEHLFLADIHTYQELIDEVKPNTFNFIFLDSLDNMHIGAQELQALKKQYAGSGLITISQATKDGKMRGSYEIIHDSDIAVMVTNGIAETIKNRFKEKDMQFDIFKD